jgi:SecD/SecF fusion protein
MPRHLRWKAFLTLGVIGLALYLALPLDQKIRLGLDLRGGMYLTLKVDTTELDDGQKKDATDRVRRIIRNRLDEAGFTESTIEIQRAKERLVIQLPGITDRKRAFDLIGRTALLEFKMVTNDAGLLTKLNEGVTPAGYEVKTLQTPSPNGSTREEKILLHKNVSLKGENLVDAFVGSDAMMRPSVDFELSSKGARIFSRLTEQNIGNRLAILLDGKVESAPTIQSHIPGGRGQITGNYTYQEARDLAIVLRAGALPAPVKIEEERTVGPTLGKDSIEMGVRSCQIGLALVLFFIIFYYRSAGVVASFALILNLLIVLAALAYSGSSLTLPGIAGLILTIGMSVDANVIIYERIREETEKGRALRSAIQNGYKSAFSAIMDANLTTFVTAFILLHLGTGPIKGFAITLSIGIVASMFTAIFVTRLVFDFLTAKDILKKFPTRRLIGESHIPFIENRRIAYTISVLCIVLGLGVLASRGMGNMGIDFTGGDLQQIRFAESVDTDSIREALVDAGYGNLPVQQFGEGTDVIIRSPFNAQGAIEESLNNRFGSQTFEILRVESVGPAVGDELTWRAIQALAWSILAIWLYITFRFKLAFALAAIFALVHDCLFTIGMFSLFGREFSLPMIAALLTIIGYSLNDTIVIFDRIRENLRIHSRKSQIQIINLSLNQTLSRTLLTSFTTIMVVATLFIGGGKVINDFAFALLVGALVGTYSSVYVASSLLVTWERRKTLVGK